MKMYLARFNKKWLTTDDQNEKIALAALLGEIGPHHPFILELVRKTPPILKEFMYRADEYVNTEDILKALVGFCQEAKINKKRRVDG